MNTANDNNKLGRRWLVVAIIVILLAINAIQLYLQNQSKHEIEENKVVISQKDDEIKVYNQKIDSIQTELKARYEEIAKLGGDTAALGDKIRQLGKDKSRLSASKNDLQKRFNKLKEEYDSYLKNKDTEIVKLKEQNEQLFKDNNNLKTTQVKLNDSISQLENKKEELAKQVALAQILKANEVKVVAITSKGKEIDDAEIKAKKIDKLKITVEVLENKVAKIESKAFFIRLVEPDGAALYDLATGGGTFPFEGKDIYYTAKQDVLYEQKNQTITFIYAKGAPYKLGKHTLEVYCEGYLIGKGFFTLR